MNWATGLLVSALVTVAVLVGWLRWGRSMPMDTANSRSLHAGSVPRIGGIAMMAGVVAAVAVQPASGVLVPLLSAVSGLFCLSMVDDWKSLPVAPRLLGHLVAAGVAVTALDLPFAVALLAVPALVWMTNLYNFMDGADGLAGGMALIGFGAYALAAMPASPAMAGVCLAIAGAAAGFLVFNIPPARVFLGDAGSVPLGFLAGALGLAGWHDGVWPLSFPVLVFATFIVDATVTLGRRLACGELIWHAHRDHCYQRLVLTGWSHRRLAGSAWGMMAATAASALAVRNQSTAWQAGALLAWSFLLGGIILMVGRRWRRATPPTERGIPPGCSGE